jgi:two-component system, OmpR family, sensor histidine kinase BaeS
MRLRIFLAFALVVLVSIVSVVTLVRLTTQREVTTFMFRGGMTGSTELVDALEAYYRENKSWQGVELLLRTPGSHGRMGQGAGQQGMAGMMNQRLRLADPEGNLVYDTGNPQATGQLSASQIDAAITLKNGSRTVGYLLPESGMAFQTGDQTALMARLDHAARIAALIAGGVSLLLAMLLAYTVLRPVRDLTNAAQSLASGQLSHRVKVSGDDELASLGKAFNQMAESLQQAEQSRRDMTADIAHELRTPLAVQRAHLEAIQDGIYPLTTESLDPVLQQNHTLARLVEDLRTLALADAGQLTLNRAPNDLTELVQHVVERFKPQANSRLVELYMQPPATPLPLISIDPVRIEQVVTNLVTNALRYTPQNGRITLSLSSGPEQVQLQVHDSGPGIPQEDMAHIFKRFYRAGHSRSREEGGTGIGLAIARQLAEAHGGTLTAANHPKGGALFTLGLPVRV